MKEFKKTDGNIVHVPDEPQREPASEGDGKKFYQCKCHKMMGNDFWFLPIACCIRDKGAVCDHERVD